ncbi:hypothetical protein ACHAQA_008469 [Verticillium albo-atrum]
MRLGSLGLAALKVGLVIVGISQEASAVPLGVNETSYHDLPYYSAPLGFGRQDGLLKRADPRDFYLRIMPVGASIVRGDPLAPDDVNKEGNGFRKALRDKLRFDGWKVNMVGSFAVGKMADNDVDAIGGQRIDETHDRIKNSVPIWQPNLYLINCGTNDAAQEKMEGAGERLRTMIETMFSHTPDATVILSTLLMHGKFQTRVENINRQIRTLVQQMQGPDLEKPRARVFLAEMQDGFIQQPRDIWDDIHPNFEGFRKMAAVWMDAINKVNALGWLQAPNGGTRFPDGESHSTCKKEPGSGANNPHGAGVKILFAGDSTIRDDGAYRHQSNARGQIFREEVPYDSEMYWAQLTDFGAPREQALDELIIVDESTDKMWVYVNRGGGRFDAKASFKVGHYCITRGIRWGDINGDGLDDYICITPDGTPYVAINTSKLGQVVPTFGAFFKWRNPISGYAQDRVLLGDIDGDGRLDYCVRHDNGDIHCYRNGGLGNGAAYWQDIGSGGPVFLNKNTGDARGLRLIDMNGDGRADWVWLNLQGGTRIFINKRGEGKGMVPYWQEASAAHPGMGEAIGSDRKSIQLGRIFGNGFADYARFYRDECNGQTCRGTVTAWENRAMDGSGGRWQKGDGAHFGDMTRSGFDDYIWISAFGQVNIFPNKNKRENFDWYKSNAWGAVVKFETGMSRRQLHIGDWNGDGLADIIGVNRASGELTIWYNNWDGKNFNFNKRTAGGTGGRCTLGWGVLYHDTAHHFADITGNGKVDYICIYPNGRMTAMLNLDTTFSDAGQIKYGEDLDRANFKFADVNGDGLADILHIDKFTGDARVFYNEGQHRNPAENGGSSFRWTRPSAAYRGTRRGPNMHYPSLSGQGRADMVDIEPNSAHGWISFNTCPAGGDDGDVVDPRLPSYSSGDPGDDDNESEHWFCDRGAGAWSPAKWEEFEMGSWLLDRISRNCDLNEATLKNQFCRANWRRAFSLWSMRNFVLYLQAYHNTILRSVVRTSLDTGLMATNFLVVENPDMSASAWLTIASGMVGSFAAIIPGVGGAGGGMLAGILTAGAGIAAGMEASPSLDPRFDSFSELQSKLGAILDAVDSATAKYFNRLIIERPPNHDMARGTELARIVESGVMADQDFGLDDNSINPIAQRQLLRAPLLSEVWNSQDVFIVKFGRNQVDAPGFKYSPCFGTNQAVEQLGRHNACPGDANWMIGRWSDDHRAMFNEGLGTAKETLELLEFTKEQIVQRALELQQRTGEWRARGMNHLEQQFKDLASSEDRTLKHLLWFNIPVCDLTTLGDAIDVRSICRENVNEPTKTMVCMRDVIRDNCAKVTLRGKAWPFS